ncbi:hypothetical protein ACOSQ3_016653 [Xanthoceras sorbifolium]
MVTRKEGTSPAYHLRAVQRLGCMKNLIPPKPEPPPDDIEDLQILQRKNTKTIQDKIRKGAITPVAQPSNRRKILPNQLMSPSPPQSMIHRFKASTAKFTIPSYRNFARSKVSCCGKPTVTRALHKQLDFWRNTEPPQNMPPN